MLDARGLRPKIRALSKVPDKQILSLEEVRLIAYYRDCGARLTNLTNGGDGSPGRVWGEESREKLRRANRGRPGYWAGKKRDPEVGRKISAANKGRSVWNKGIPLSEDCKAKLSEAMRGRKPTQETRRKLEKVWAIRRGKKRPVSVCRKISEALKGRPGRAQSDEIRRKISEGMRQYRAKLAQREKA